MTADALVLWTFIIVVVLLILSLFGMYRGFRP